MPDEEFIQWKRKKEDARAWDQESPIYDDDSETKTRVFNFSSAILILFILVFCIIVPFIGYIYGFLDMRW
jgi:hypothetical protein